MNNTLFAILAFVFFAVIGFILFPIEGERMFTPATFIITQLLVAIYIRVLDILDLLKQQSK